MTMTETTPAPLFPSLTGRLVPTILLAGVAADLTWEVWARGITPFLVGGPLEPAALVQSVFGFQSWAAAELIHAIVGIVFYPIGYLFIARPLQRRILPQLPLVLTGIGFGTGLWVFALYVMAHIFAGLPAFLGFIPLTWASLVGHILFGLVVAYVVRFRESQPAESAPR
ncbi:YqhR family membrane protein [Inquilinus sp. Marseille-Q2685]|uniref:YqhR family membrane protein n=1 Tax=Inquilinus sp. Marseille-Q2685 TaxID=2866581 RepID=UPI001CE3BA76|nr:YqhR family membrane protein [Inquilinus sp. Marseille-Q2685]